MLKISDSQLARIDRAFWNPPGVPVLAAGLCEDAFWVELAAMFPGTDAADLDTAATWPFMQLCREAVEEHATEGLRPETNARLREAMRKIANEWLALQQVAR